MNTGKMLQAATQGFSQTVDTMLGVERYPRWHDDSELLWLQVVGVPLDDWIAADTMLKFRMLLLRRRLGVYRNYIATELFKQGTANRWIGSEW